MEALYFGVPVIGIPLFYDQNPNVHLLVTKNMCTVLDHNEITENNMDLALSKMLNDTRVR